MDIKEIKKKSINNYLFSLGLVPSRRGDLLFYNSPFNSDSTPSFVVYPDNHFVDYSSGNKGDIIELVRKIENLNFYEAINRIESLDLPEEEIVEIKKEKKFSLERFINKKEDQIERIRRYAKSRGITEGYLPGVYHECVADNEFVQIPSLMFVHVNENLIPCGAKFRKLVNENPRFSARGKLKYYILENIIDDDPVVYIVESESSANSLWMYLRKIKISSVVISFGSVGSIPKDLPKLYEEFKRKIIIDYDGNHKLYEERIEKYKHLKATPIKIILNKGEDLNSLFQQNKMYLINSLL